MMKRTLIIKISTLLLCAWTFFAQANDKTDIRFNTQCIKILQIDVDKIANIDAIVNPANRWLKHGGGIAGALSKAAGPELQKDSDRIIQLQPNSVLAASSVIATESYDLSKKGIKKIFHAVGPDCRNPEENSNRKELLRKTYQNIFAKAKEEGLKSIAIPSISTGIFGYPDTDEATQIAISCIAHAFKDGLDIVIYAHDEQTINRYWEAILKTDLPFFTLLKSDYESK